MSAPLIIERIRDVYMAKRGHGHTIAAIRGLKQNREGGVLVVPPTSIEREAALVKAKSVDGDGLFVVASMAENFEGLTGYNGPILFDNEVLIQAGFQVQALREYVDKMETRVADLDAALKAVETMLDAAKTRLDTAIRTAKDRMDFHERVIEEKDAEIKRLNDVLHTPLIGEFFAAVKNEASHQVERWKSSHDEGKTDGDWFWLIGYIAGKVLWPDADNAKQRHRIIAIAAVAYNWWRRKSGMDTGMRPGTLRAE